MSIFLKIVTIVTSLIFCTEALAIYMYRSDTRPPSEIFYYGFDSPGRNQDLLDHIEGISCFGVAGCITPDLASAYISTSSNYNFSTRFATSNPRGSTFWVYTIRPDNHFYNLMDSLEASYRSTENIYLRESIRAAVDAYRDQYEYIAVNNIDPDTILCATEYLNVGEDEEPVMVNIHQNTNYVSRQTDVNPAPLVVDESVFNPSYTTSDSLVCESDPESDVPPVFLNMHQDERSCDNPKNTCSLNIPYKGWCNRMVDKKNFCKKLIPNVYLH
ncbi:hypothetical protein [Serratia surfactantfaciens]|uniref:hypothetical protein n=1 Tax=Serratia surfactantfaciens TaxID=2741499 RepID=UPI001B3C7677|nr:hypothetical protein [Serratia surfactantfaciens]